MAPPARSGTLSNTGSGEIDCSRRRKGTTVSSKLILAALLVTTVSSSVLTDRVAAAPRPDGASATAAHASAARRAAPGSKELLHLIFRDGTDVRLRGGKLVSPSGSTDLGAVQAILDAAAGAKVERLFRASEDKLAKLKTDGEKRTGNKSPDLNLQFLVRLPKGADITKVSSDLAAVTVVKDAYAEPLPVDPPTASFVAKQGYRIAAPDGINVAAASGIPGGTGSRVKIIDIENGWNTSHEDLASSRGKFIANGTPMTNYNTDHGTAVLGELIGSNNAFGVTGIVPDAGIGMVNSYTESAGVIRNEFQNAMILATQNLVAGDVILIEQHYPGPRSGNNVGTSQFGYLPVEYWTSFYDAIRTATAKGIIVVEAAGNGEQNLDDPIYGGFLSVGGPRADSGAIMVGGGNAPGCGTESARSRMWFSNFGTRVDVQAWGECVTTTGYSDLQNIVNANYTSTFSGTSSASPIVAGAAAILSSVTEARTGVAATPAKVRAALKTGGAPQTSGTYNGNIGAMPDLKQALPAMAGDTTAPVVGTISQAAATGYKASATTVPTTISWSATDASGILAYYARVSVNGANWTPVTLPSATATSAVFDLTPGASYTFQVAARDKVGTWSAYKNGPTFTPTLIAENHAAIRYSTSFIRSAWAPAIGGYVSVSGTTGASATVTFTGRNIAWIGTKATNRGQADLWLDGTYLGRIDLYSATTSPATVLYSRNVTTGVTHTLQIAVVGTAGRPKLDVDGFAILK
jgi:serine protease